MSRGRKIQCQVAVGGGSPKNGLHEQSSLQPLFELLSLHFYLNLQGILVAMANSSSANGNKRRRSADDDEAYFDNYHIHKRFLTEVMASSMNGLSVCDALPVNRTPSSPMPDTVLSPAETQCTISRSASSFPGDEVSSLDSPMSDDSDIDSIGYRYTRGTEGPVYPTTPVTSEFSPSPQLTASFPISSRRGLLQKSPCNGTPGQIPIPGSPLPWSSNIRMPATSSWRRFPETEGRLPPSPNDACQAPDLRRATLLRNLSMRNQMPAQVTTCNAPDVNTSKAFQDNDENGDQMSVNAMLYDYTSEQVGCNTSIMGSPTHGLFPSHVMRGSSRVRSLVLGDSTALPKAFLNNEGSSSGSKSEGLMLKVEKPTRFEEEFSSTTVKVENPTRYEEEFSSTNRSPPSPSGAASSDYEISSSVSPKDGVLSDAESI